MPGTISLYAIIAIAIAGMLVSTDRRLHTYLAWIQFFLSGFVLSFTLIGILRGWYCYQYIFHNSDRSLPLMYKFSALWSGDAGSLILWLFMVSIITLIVSCGDSNRRQGLKIVYPLLAMIAILILLGDPFRLVSPVPSDGMGLNLLLQNPWMVSHPPVVFASYALMVVPFALTVSFLANPGPQNIPKWRKAVKPWLIASWLLLGLGIFLGAVWAYETLGWGGYWGWDPVENSSLIPWLLITVAVHAVVIDEGTNLGLKAAITSILASFVSMMAAVFITRSGALSNLSVHTFAGSGWAFWVILAGFAGYLALSVVKTVKSWKLLPKTNQTESFTKPVTIGIGNIAMTVFAAIVLGATIMPMFGGMSLTYKFYQTVLLPVAFIMIVGSGISPILSWKAQSFKHIQFDLGFSISVGVLTTLMLQNDGNWLMFLLSFSAGFCIGANLICMRKAKLVRIGSYVAHIGLAVMAIGIAASSIYQDSFSFDLPRNTLAKSRSYSITLSSYDLSSDGNNFISSYKLDHGSKSWTGLLCGKWDSVSQAWMFTPSFISKFPDNVMITISNIRESLFFDMTMAGVSEREGYSLELVEFKDSSAVVILKDGSQTFKTEAFYDQINPIPAKLEENLELLYRGDGTFALTDRRPDRKGTIVFNVTISERRLLFLVWLGSIILIFGITVSLLKSLYSPKIQAPIGVVKACEC